MSEENNTATYLCISENKYEIYLFDKDKLKRLFSNETSINRNSLDHESLDSFLDENIIQIEKLTGKFIAFTIAGGSIGLTNDKFKKWHSTFWENLETSIKIGGVRKRL